MGKIRKVYEDRVLPNGDHEEIYPVSITKAIYDEVTKESLDKILDDKQNETDERLVTESKEVVGAINELAEKKLSWSEF